MPADVAPDPDLLLRHWSFVRALARRVAIDESAADDLAQETWLAAHAGPVASVRSTRGWLAGVISHLWREQVRGEGRRRLREKHAARAEALPPESETIEAAETGRELVGLVLELEEPFRATVLLRYFHDLPPRAIAERLGVPVRTVNSRLSRGLERVREAWKRRHHGDARGGLRALILLARPPASAAGASAVSIGVSVMSAKSILVGAIAVGAVALLFVWNPKAPRARPRDVAGASSSADSASHDVATAGATSIESERAPAADRSSGAAASPESPQVAAERRAIRGRVLDPEARPLAAVDVVFRRNADAPIEARAASTAAGRYELDAPRTDGIVTVDDPTLVTLCYGRVLASTALEPLIVAAPFRGLGGRAIDEFGAPLPGALVRLVLPPSFRTRFDAPFDASEMQSWSEHSDERGRFDLERAPVVAQAQLIASLDGYTDAAVDAPPGESRELLLVLTRPTIEGASIVGRVEDSSGAPAPWARVSVGARATLSDAHGAFRVPLYTEQPAFELVALRRGSLPGRVRASEDPVTGAPLWPDFVVVRLGGPPLSIAGRAVDPAGKPIADMRVWISDPTLFGELRDEVHGKVEYLLASTEPPNSDSELSQAHWSYTHTDADGRFRIEGLLPRAYSLQLMHPKTLGALNAGPFEAGEQHADIVFDTGRVYRVAGRLVTRGGEPIANASIALMGYAFEGVSIDGDVVTTGADGRFEFEGIGMGELSLWIRGDDLMPVLNPISDVTQASALEIAVSVRCHVKVECSGGAKQADSIRIFDEDEEALKLHEIGPGGDAASGALSLVDGRSKAFSVASEARTLVLFKEGVEVQRVSLNLVPGRLNLVRP